MPAGETMMDYLPFVLAVIYIALSLGFVAGCLSAADEEERAMTKE